MKIIKLLLVLFVFCTARSNAQLPSLTETHPKIDDKKAARFQFVGDVVHDFGNISDATDAVYNFQFKNFGKAALIITNITASCSCMEVGFSKEPVMPGAKSFIKITFHPAGKIGPFFKTVFIQSNAASEKDRYEIYVKGSVTPSH